ncbi:hypothetical protein ACSBOB_16430 [Mesorhizobium sp. ASY16-5R]|uniref:hypothetical protein n=1 Tax=Mesorhizobium sp. ASY16-5R TaxID=3445772 RepID=UPI003F9ED2E6
MGWRNGRWRNRTRPDGGAIPDETPARGARREQIFRGMAAIRAAHTAAAMRLAKPAKPALNQKHDKKIQVINCLVWNYSKL